MAGNKIRAVRGLCWAALLGPTRRHDEARELARSILEATGIQGVDGEIERMRAQEDRAARIERAGQELERTIDEDGARRLRALEGRLGRLEGAKLEERIDRAVVRRLRALEERLEALENGKLEERIAWLDAKLQGLEEEIRAWTAAAGKEVAGIRVRIGTEENDRERLEAKLESRFHALEDRWEGKHERIRAIVEKLVGADLAEMSDLRKLEERVDAATSRIHVIDQWMSKAIGGAEVRDSGTIAGGGGAGFPAGAGPGFIVVHQDPVAVDFSGCGATPVDISDVSGDADGLEGPCF